LGRFRDHEDVIPSPAPGSVVCRQPQNDVDDPNSVAVAKDQRERRCPSSRSVTPHARNMPAGLDERGGRRRYWIRPENQGGGSIGDPGAPDIRHAPFKIAYDLDAGANIIG